MKIEGERERVPREEMHLDDIRMEKFIKVIKLEDYKGKYEDKLYMERIGSKGGL